MKKKVIFSIVALVVIIGAYFAWDYHKNALYRNKALTCGNGRLEATEIYLASKLNGKIENINVTDGDYVKKGQVLAIAFTIA